MRRLTVLILGLVGLCALVVSSLRPEKVDPVEQELAGLVAFCDADRSDLR